MSKFAVILYPDFSLQEITCLTSALSVWFEEKIDFIASENRVLDGRKFTAGFFMQMAETFSFVENENFIHKGIVCDGNVITGIGMFFREFAETVLHKFGYDVGSNFMRGNPEDYTEEELTFYWSEEDYRQFLKELKEYEK